MSRQWLAELRRLFALSSRRRSRRLAGHTAAQVRGEHLESRQLLTTFINAGGPALGGDPGFVSDDGFENGEGRDISRRAAIDTLLVDASLPEALFQTTLMDRPRSGDMAFDIPVEAGKEYQVDLLFSEFQNRGSDAAARIFDVSIEGDVVLDDFNIFAEVGRRTAVSKSFEFTATDNNLDIDFGRVKANPIISGIVVTEIGGTGEVNSPPTIGAVGNQTVNENEVVGPITFTVADPDGDPVIVTGASSNPGLIPNSSIFVSGAGINRTVTITPTPNASGTAVITLLATDGTDTATQAFTVTVNDNGGPVNTAPVLSDVTHQTIDENQAVGPINFSVTDADGDVVTVTATSSNQALIPDSAIVVTGTGTARTITITPAVDTTGTAQITLTATDGTEFVTDTFTVTVNEVVDPPDPELEPMMLNAGGGPVGDFESAAPFVSDSRTRTPRRPDPVTGVPAGIPMEVFQTGIFSRPRDGALHFDIPNEVGVEYQVDLLFAETQKRSAGRRIFDVAIDGQPVLNHLDVFARVGHDAALVESFVIEGDGNLDIDLNKVRNQPLIAGIIVTPLSDPGSGTNVAPDLANINGQTVSQNSLLQLTAVATDADGDPLTYSLDSTGLPGNPTINPQTGLFAWTPPTVGTFTVTISATDGQLTDSESFTVTVTEAAPVNRPPVIAQVPPQQATVDQPLTFNVTATDPDAGDVLTYSVGPNAPAGLAINSSTGQVTWTPATADIGSNIFTVTVSDGELTASTNVTINVTDPNSTNQPPAFGPVQNQSVEANQQLIVDPAAFDPDDNDTLTYFLDTTGLPGNPAVDATTGRFTWTPPASAVPGPFLVTLRVTDAGGLSDTVSFSVSVTDPNSTNNPPVLGAIGNQGATVGSQLTFTATATDADGPQDTLQYFLTAEAPSGATINPATGVFTWTPQPGDVGTHTFSVGVTDGEDSDTEQITITVTASNTAPVLAAIGDQTVEAGQLLTVNVTATDTPGDSLTYSLVNTDLPGNAQIDATTGVFTWNPPFIDGPGVQVTVQVTDSGGLTDTESFTVIITEGTSTNSPPVFDPVGVQNANVGQEVSFTVSATDSDIPPDTLTYFLDPTAPNGAAINGSTGVFTWTPQTEGSVTFPVLVSDGTISVSMDVTINVGPQAANQPPAFGPVGNQQATVNTEFQFTLPATDPENDALTFTLVTTGLLGNPTVDANTGVFTWTPTQLSPGFDVTVRVTDSGGLSDTITFTVTVNDADPPGNTPPTFGPIGTQQATVGQLLTFTVNATDPDPGTTLNFFLDPTAPGGTSINAQTGVLTWTPTVGDVGTNTFPVFVSDGIVNVSQQVTVVVTNSGGGGGPNSAPTFGPQNNRSVAAGTQLNVLITATDNDPGDTLTYTLVTAGLPGNPSINPQTGQFTWTPPASAAGQDFQVAIRATDNGGLSDDAIFTVTVLPEGTGNQPPVITAVPQQQATVGQQLAFMVNATDANGDTLTYFLDPTAPFSASINSTTGEFTWTPSSSDVGTVTFPIFVGDGTTNVSVNVTVVVSEDTGGGNPNTSPSLAPIEDQTVDEGATLTVTPIVDDPDQGDVHTFELLTTGLPGNAVVDPTTGVFTWTPPNNAGPQSYTVTIQVTDAGGLSTTGTFTVQVNDTL